MLNLIINIIKTLITNTMHPTDRRIDRLRRKNSKLFQHGVSTPLSRSKSYHVIIYFALSLKYQNRSDVYHLQGRPSPTGCILFYVAIDIDKRA